MADWHGLMRGVSKFHQTSAGSCPGALDLSVLSLGITSGNFNSNFYSFAMAVGIGL
jgi:hypothetical protein